MVTLAEARAVKYADFVRPGQTLTVSAEMLSHDKHESKLKAVGAVNGNVNVSARLTLRRYNLADLHPERSPSDVIVRAEMRKLFSLLYRPAKAEWNGARTNRSPIPATVKL
jgi:3-hydroxyacyl-[acyl-carrier-protein] dehydratase